MFFNEINICFTLLINLEMWQSFVHLFFKNLAFLMFKGVEKVLVSQKIISVSAHHYFLLFLCLDGLKNP
jgi:hypothetical protein